MLPGVSLKYSEVDWKSVTCDVRREQDRAVRDHAWCISHIVVSLGRTTAATCVMA